MITQEEAQKMYANKYFYEVVPGEKGSLDHTLVGPLEGIRFLVPGAQHHLGQDMSKEYHYAQVMDGKVVAAFTEQEIVVLDFDVTKVKGSEI